MKTNYVVKASANPQALDLYMYDDIQGNSLNWFTGKTEVSETSDDFVRKALAAAKNISQINIFINSYGGSVMEGVAIVNLLKRHSAKKTVYVDGFACSIASVIAMVGDKVIMASNAVMMIHHAWMVVAGNPKDLRKAADDLQVIDDVSNVSYLEKAGAKLTPEKLTELLDAETWLSATQCIEYGLADEITGQEPASITTAKARVKQAIQDEVNQKLNAVTVPKKLAKNKTNAEKLMEAFKKKQER